MAERCIGRKLTTVGLADVADHHRCGATRICRPIFDRALTPGEWREADTARVAVGARRAEHEVLAAAHLAAALVAERTSARRRRRHEMPKRTLHTGLRLIKDDDGLIGVGETLLRNGLDR